MKPGRTKQRDVKEGQEKMKKPKRLNENGESSFVRDGRRAVPA